VGHVVAPACVTCAGAGALVLVFGGRDVAETLVESVAVEPADVADQLGLEAVDERLGDRRGRAGARRP
jgi:hypothetical protein